MISYDASYMTSFIGDVPKPILQHGNTIDVRIHRQYGMICR